MIPKRGRKRKNELYFGPDEEEAVVKFLDSRYVETINLSANRKHKVIHKLGIDVEVSVNYIIENEIYYHNDDRYTTVEASFTVDNISETSMDITTSESIVDATIIITNEIERNIIFNEWLKAPLDKMIESIIRRYKLYRKGETFEELHGDTVSFLMTKVHKFDTGIGKKAYSYFGTIAKHYILGLLIKDEKYMRQTAAYDDVCNEIESRDDLTYIIDSDEFSMDKFIKNLTDGIKLELLDENSIPKKKLSENERKVGYALIAILENWETAFQTMDGGSKYNKNSVLETMRNYTNLTTKDIRLAMKRYIILYDGLKQFGL